MIRARLFFCADSTALDVRTQTVSAFHIMEFLNAVAFPVVVPRISVAALFERDQNDPQNFELQLSAIAGEQPLFVGPFPVNFAQQMQARTVVEMNGLLLPSPGTLRMLLGDGDRLVASWVITVNQIGQPQAQLVFAQPPPPAAPQNR